MEITGTITAHFIGRHLVERFLEQTAKRLGRALMRVGARRWSKMRRQLRRKFPFIVGTGKVNERRG